MENTRGRRLESLILSLNHFPSIPLDHSQKEKKTMEYADEWPACRASDNGATDEQECGARGAGIILWPSHRREESSARRRWASNAREIILIVCEN